MPAHRLTLVDGSAPPASTEKPVELCRIEGSIATRVLVKQSKRHPAQWIVERNEG